MGLITLNDLPAQSIEPEECNLLHVQSPGCESSGDLSERRLTRCSAEWHVVGTARADVCRRAVVLSEDKYWRIESQAGGMELVDLNKVIPSFAIYPRLPQTQK